VARRMLMGLAVVAKNEEKGRKEPPTRRRSLGGRALRLARAAGVAVLATEAFYLAAMNGFLSTPLFEEAIDGTPLVVDIHYARGWSFFPTRIHAKGLSIRGTDSHVEWILRFDEVEFDCSLLALARREFHVTRARGSGITFRARLKVASPEATDALVESLPPIDSLGPVGLIPSDPRSPADWDDKQWHLWTVEIDDAVAEHVREVWIEGGRFQGDARIKGGFFLKPLRAARVGPAHVEVQSGAVAWDARTVAEPLVANIDFELAEFDPRQSSDTDIFPRISLSVDGATAVPNLDNLGLELPDSGQVRGRVEVPRIALRIVNGVVRDGTHVDAHAGEILVTTAAHAASGGVELTADVAHERLAVRALLTGIDGDRALTIPRATIVADSAALGLLEPMTDLHGVLDVADMQLRDAARIMDVLPKKASFRIDGGHVSGSLHAEVWRSEERVRASSRVRAKSLHVTVGRLHAHGDADVEGTADVHLDGRRALATIDARAPAIALEYAGRRLDAELMARARAHTLGATGDIVALDEGSLVATHIVFGEVASPPALSVERISFAATSSGLALADPLARLDLVASVAGGRMTAPSALGDLLAAGSDAQGGRFEGDLALRIAGHVARGAGSLRAHGIGVAGTKLRLSGDVSVVADVARWDLKQRVLRGSIAVTVNNATGGFGRRAGVPDFAADRIEGHATATALDLANPSMFGVDYGFHVDRAELADARALNTFLPSPTILAFESGSGLLSADVATAGILREAVGRVDISIANGGIRLHETHLSGDFAAVVHAHGFDPMRAVVDLEGSRIEIKNVRVTGASTDTSAWSGELVLQSGSLGLAPRPRLEGDLTLEARDASPLLAVLFHDSLPKFVADLTRMPRLSAVAHVAIEPDALTVSDLFASGGDLALRGTYVLRGADRDAAFVVQKGPWSVGISFDEASHLRLFGLDRWYGDHVRAALAPR